MTSGNNLLYPGKKRRACSGRGKLLPPPQRSGRIYVRIRPSLVHLFRFHLEAMDNLGIMTIVDRWDTVLMLRFSPHQEQEAREFLATLEEPLGLKILPTFREKR